MARFLRISLIAAAVMALAATGAMANIPDASLSNVPDYLTVTPTGDFDIVIQVNGPQGGVNSAVVDIEFSADATGLIAWADPIPASAATPVHYETTPGEPYRAYRVTADANGEARIKIAAGGCLTPSGFDDFGGGPFIVQVRADNVFLGEVAVNSPDAVNKDGYLPTDSALEASTCAGGTSEVGLADASFAAAAITGGLVQPCTKFTAPYSDPVTLADASILADYITAGAGETCN